MRAARCSYLKTVSLCAGAAVLAFAMAKLVTVIRPPVLAVPLSALGLLAGMALALAALCGLLVLYRDRRAANGQPDLFLVLNRSRSEAVLTALPAAVHKVAGAAWRRVLAPRGFQVGELVEVRPWAEISATLDAAGALEGVPFMAEMLPCCGKRARVLRVVDKVYDYGASKTLRRMDNCVLLAGFRCNGSDHGGCQARCSMFWKLAWLKPVHAAAQPHLPQHTSTNTERALPAAASKRPGSGDQPDRYVCQYTQVVASSSPLSTSDVRQDLRPLLAGNVTLPSFVVALMTWFFNRLQGWRGGVPFPGMANSGQLRTPADARTQADARSLLAGDSVRVLGSDDIGKTLDRTNRNRGLWFDREMTKHCHKEYAVEMRVDQIIDDVTGRMLPMKTPCILLTNVVASGEFLHFCSQQEYIFWREVWLQKANP